MENKILLSVSEILDKTRGELICGKKELKIDKFTIDSRKFKRGYGYIAIKGVKHDGHSFLDEVYKRGCRFFIVSNGNDIENIKNGSTIIRTPDTSQALLSVAALKRAKSKAKLIAITGSCGKTTTKEMLYAILRKKYKVLKSKGNYNNRYGLALTLLELTNEYQIVIAEMGMNHANEIRQLNEAAQADIAIITCVYPVHLAFFKSIEKIAEAKWELIETLAGNKPAILNADSRQINKLIKKDKPRVKIISFAVNNDADYKATDIMIKGMNLYFKLNKRHNIAIKALGSFNAYNALAAIAAARELRTPYKTIVQALKSFKMPAMRMQHVKCKGVNFINDGYNSNPKSVELALMSLSNINSKSRKIAVLSDMKELGLNSRRFHKELGRLVAEKKIDILITYGNEAKWISESALKEGMSKKQVYHFITAKKVANKLKSLAMDDDTILLKGSRMMKTEEIIECFMNSYTR
jgi:UDP-N-acetylmuramoyl-tripeptide--D-alanyl-D-alanine ligase